jgi:hypothetical protein
MRIGTALDAMTTTKNEAAFSSIARRRSDGGGWIY